MKNNLISKVLTCALAVTLVTTSIAPGTVYAGQENETIVTETALSGQESETADVEAAEETGAAETETVTEETGAAETETAAEETSEVETDAETENVETAPAGETETAAEETETAETETVQTETEISEETESQERSASSFTNLQCGEDVYATLSGGTLTISGTGTMYDNGNTYMSVFYDYLDYIREVVVKDGVTSIGNDTFAVYSGSGKIEKLTLGNSVEVIGEHAFYGQSIRRLVCPSSLKTIGKQAFYYDTSLQMVSFNDGLETIGKEAFYFTNLKEVVIPEGCVYDTNTSFGNVKIHQKTTVTLNANGGNINGAQTAQIVQYEKEAYGNPTKLPTPVRSGYEFLGWYDYTDGVEGNNVTADGETVKYHADLRAKWCNHSRTEVKNALSATYEKDGYTGDTYCADCGKRLALGKTIAHKNLAAPKMSSVDNVKNGLKVRWVKSKDAKGYYVYRKKDGVYKKIATVKNGTSYVDESVKNSTGTTFSYKVCAYYGKATSNMTGAKSQVRVAASSIRSLNTKVKKALTVNWSKVSKCNGYQIQYSKDKNFKKNVTTKTIKSGSKTSQKITKLSKGKKYYVRVRSYKVVKNKKYYSAWSSAKSATVK